MKALKQPTLSLVEEIRTWPRRGILFIGDSRWVLLSFGLVITFITLLLGYRLYGLTNHNLAASELFQQNKILHGEINIPSILHNPINLPFTLGLFLLQKIHIYDALYLRSLAVVVAGISILGFFVLLKMWYSKRVAILGTILFATSAWNLHIARLGEPEVLLMLPVTVLICATWLQTSRHRRWLLTCSLVTAVFLIYIPGMILFVLAAIVWQAKNIYNQLKHTSWWFIVPWALLGLSLMTPLIWMLLTAPHNTLALLGLPAKLPSLKQFGNNLIDIPIHFFVRGPTDPVRWLGQLPLLDIFCTALAFTGIYAYAFRYKLSRTKLLVVVFAGGSLLIALGGGVTITFLMPFIFIVIAGGMAYLLRQWTIVFPRNPFAKILATSLMTIVVLFSAFYNLSHYFIAWPQAPSTKAVFNQK
ncbi:MAG: hypothetical protein NVS1B7_6860 [Candidatus Saccharimonadales bacterium]